MLKTAKKKGSVLNPFLILKQKVMGCSITLLSLVRGGGFGGCKKGVRSEGDVLMYYLHLQK